MKYDKTFKCANIFIETADGKKNPNLVIARGTVQIPVTDVDDNECYMILKNALYVPSFHRNIVSMHLAIKKGYKFHLNDIGNELMSSPKATSLTRKR